IAVARATRHPAAESPGHTQRASSRWKAARRREQARCPPRLRRARNLRHEIRIEFDGRAGHTKWNGECRILVLFQLSRTDVDQKLIAFKLRDGNQHSAMGEQRLKLSKQSWLSCLRCRHKDWLLGLGRRSAGPVRFSDGF